MNRVALSWSTRHVVEQPGCIHANMDLYRWAYTSMPWIGSDLLWDCFALATELRARPDVTLVNAEHAPQHACHRPPLDGHRFEPHAEVELARLAAERDAFTQLVGEAKARWGEIARHYR